MRLDGLSRGITVLGVILAGLLLVDAWYAIDTVQVRGDIQRTEDNMATEKRTLRALQTTSQLSAARQELADLQAKAPAGIRQPLPTEVDTLKVVSDLIGNQMAAGKMTSFRAKEPKAETIDGVAFQALGFEVGLQGSAQELLALVKRVDESNLATLKIQSFGADRVDENWSTKLDITLYVLAPASATATPAAGKGR